MGKSDLETIETLLAKILSTLEDIEIRLENVEDAVRAKE